MVAQVVQGRQILLLVLPLLMQAVVVVGHIPQVQQVQAVLVAAVLVLQLPLLQHLELPTQAAAVAVDFKALEDLIMVAAQAVQAS
jgi:hypothetical protein